MQPVLASGVFWKELRPGYQQWFILNTIDLSRFVMNYIGTKSCIHAANSNQMSPIAWMGTTLRCSHFIDTMCTELSFTCYTYFKLLKLHYIHFASQRFKQNTCEIINEQVKIRIKLKTIKSKKASKFNIHQTENSANASYHFCVSNQFSFNHMDLASIWTKISNTKWAIHEIEWFLSQTFKFSLKYRAESQIR